MGRAFFYLFLGLFAALPIFGKEEKAPTSILFIGNSYTFFNNLPVMLKSLAEQKGHHVRVESYAKAATTLMDYMVNPDHAPCRELVKNGGFDYVILQDQSQTPYFTPERTIVYGKQWCELIKASGAKPVLFITWAHAQASKKGPLEPLAGMQNGLTTTYCRLAVETGAQTAPVGEAWRFWHRKFPTVALHAKDGSHPNTLGSYLAACVIYGAIWQKSPEGLPAQIKHGNRILRFPAVPARNARKIAAATLKHFSPARFLEVRAAADAKLPTLDELMPLLQQGATMAPLLKKLGKPALKQADALCYPLRGGSMLHLTPGESGKVRQAIVTDPNGRPNAILLQP